MFSFIKKWSSNWATQKNEINKFSSSSAIENLSSSSDKSMPKKIPKINDDSVLHFPLTELWGFDPKKLFEKPEFLKGDQLILTLALAYNDVKGLLFNWEILQEFAPEKPETGICKFDGQAAGMLNQSFRHQIGFLHELIKLLNSQKTVIESQIIKDIESGLPPDGMKSWNELKRLALGKKIPEELKPFRTAIAKIHDKGAFHYDSKILINPYIQHFKREQPQSDYAYVCFGKNLEESRFFFADAAIADYHNSIFAKDLGGKLAEYLRHTNIGLGHLIMTYLKSHGIEFVVVES